MVNSELFIEIIATITGILGVWLTTRLNIYNFPVSLVSVALSGYLFYNKGLYADALLQLYFSGFLVYGWLLWSNRISKNNNILNVTYLTINKRVFWTISILISGFIIGYFLPKIKPDAKYPFVDSFLAVISMVAQYLQGLKKQETWWLWILADLIYIPLFLFLGLKLFALLYVLYLFFFFYFFLFLCFSIVNVVKIISKIQNWRKSMRLLR